MAPSERAYEQAFDQQEEVGDRHEILVGVVGQVIEDQRVDRHGRVVDEAERVAVRRRLGAGLGARNAGGAALVLDHDRVKRVPSSGAAARMITSVTLPTAIGTISRIGRAERPPRRKREQQGQEGSRRETNVMAGLPCIGWGCAPRRRAGRRVAFAGGYLSWSATLSRPVCAQASSESPPGAPDTPTFPSFYQWSW